MTDKILLIDDEKPTVEMISTLLTERGFEMYKAYCAQEGLRKAYLHQPDLVLLDIMLPDMDGWEICKRLRELSDMPIIFISARKEKSEVVKGFEVGADDYVAKPFDDDVLVARIKARLRRPTRVHLNEELVFSHGNFRINFMNREVMIGDKLTHLTPKEFSLLTVLARNAGRVVTRDELVFEAWGQQQDNSNSLKLYIHYLRQKLETNPQQPEYILTSRGVGYRFAKR